MLVMPTFVERRHEERTLDIREVRLLASWRDGLLRLCKLIFSARDASIYLVPYARGRRFFSGGSAMPERELTDTLRYPEGIESDREPKLSLHESGQVHVLAGSTRVGPLHTLPLATFRGEHVATVCFDRFENLSPFQGAPADSGPERDLVIPVESGVESGRFALYLNGIEPVFAGGECWFTVTIRRPTLTCPLYLCVRAIPQEPLGEAPRSGVTVLAGWNPALADLAHQNYLYVRGQ